MNEFLTTERTGYQMTTDRHKRLTLLLFTLALAPKVTNIFIMFSLGTISPGTSEAGLDSRHQLPVHGDADLCDYLYGLPHAEPEPDKLHDLTLSGEILGVSCGLTIQEVAQVDKSSRRVTRRDSTLLLLGRDRALHTLGRAKTLHRDDGRGRPVASTPSQNDDSRNRFSLKADLPGPGWAGVHLWLISNRDQFVRGGRRGLEGGSQTLGSLHSRQRQFWRFARRHGPYDMLRVFAELSASQNEVRGVPEDTKSSAYIETQSTQCSCQSNR